MRLLKISGTLNTILILTNGASDDWAGLQAADRRLNKITLYSYTTQSCRGMSSNSDLTNEKDEENDKTEQDNATDIRKIERRNAVVLEPEDLAHIFPEKKKTQEDLDST